MSQHTTYRRPVLGPASLGLLFAALLLGISCGPKLSGGESTDPRLPILEEQTKMLMILEAQQGFNELFKTSFKHENTQLLVGEALKRWLEEKKSSLNLVPEEIKTAIAKNQGAGLLIKGGLPGKNGGTHDVVYLRPSTFGGRRFFLTLDPDPCGDGNPATCERCSGCSGESSPGGIIVGCYCTFGCDTCRPCPSC